MTIWKKPALLIFLLILFIEIIYSLHSCQSNTSKEDLATETDRLTDKDYVGSETCQSCHKKQYEDWELSHHDQAMMKADDQSVKGDFNTTFTSQGVTTKFYRKHDKYYVNTEGPDGTYQDYEVIYTFGITPLQQYIVKFPDGRFQCLSTAWDVEKSKWFELYPNEGTETDEWLHWSGGALNWNTMCSDCHSTNVHKNFNEGTESFNTTFSIIDVSCEACHGPGKEHVEWVSIPAFDSAQYNATEHLKMTSALTSKEQVDQCARCHSRRVQHTEAFNHEGEFMDHYTPEILRDNLYYADGQILDEVYVYGSFIQSKMYQMNVKCSDCHNPHSLELKMIGNALCGQCHAPDSYNTSEHHFHAIDTEGSQCINCHMPGRYYMGNDYRRDHSFRIPRPDLSVNYAVPNACNQCHEDQSAEWAAEAVNKWFGPERPPHFSETLVKGSTRSPEAIPYLVQLSGDTTQPAIARGTAVWYLDEIVSQESINAIVTSLDSKDHIVRYTAVNALIDLPQEQKVRYLAPLLKDDIKTVRLAAANALADVPLKNLKPEFGADFSRVIQEYQKSLAVRADFPGGQFEKGQFFDRTGREHLAEAAYLKALKFDNRLNVARVNLAYLYNRQGKNNEAIKLFKVIIDQEPEFVTAYYALGLLYAEENKMEVAVEFLEKAAELDQNPRIYYNLGVAYQQLGQAAHAEKAYLRGLKLEEDNLDLMYALTTVYLQLGALKKAKPFVEKLLQAYPTNAELRQVYNRIMAAQ